MSQLNVDTIKKADGTGNLSVPAETGTVVTTASPSLGRRNWLINSDFQVSQRGDYTSASSVTNGNYWVDRFVSLFSTVTSTYQHQYSQEINSDITANTIKVVATSSGTGFIGHQQSIENVNNQLGNKTITISVWVKSNNANTRLRGIFDGTGWTEYSGAVHTGDGTWQKLTATFTTGATRTGHYSLQFITYNGGSVSVSSGDYIEIAQPQVEIGSVATSFEHRSYGEELALCQRYFHRASRGTIIGAYINSNRVDATIHFPTTMRATPTMTASSGANYWYAYTGSIDYFNAWSGAGGASVNNGSMYVSSGEISGPDNAGCQISFSTNDSYFQADAEL